MRFRVISCVLAMVLLAAVIPARADKAEDAVVALAVSRAKAELAVKNAQYAVDEHRSGWATLWQLTELTRNKTYTLLEGRQQSEERNAEEARDQTLIGQIQTRLTKLREDWDGYNVKERAALNLTWQDASETVSHLSQALDSLSNAERAWKDANLEPATLQAAYDTIAKKAAEMRTAADQTLATAKSKQKAIDGDLDEVNTFLGRAK